MQREKLFMIDIEATGVNLKRDDILEIAIVEMLPDSDGFYVAGGVFHQFIHSPRQPESQFAKEHMVEVYHRANATPPIPRSAIRDGILAFLGDCGKKGHEVLFCGWNASNFDLPMMHAHGFLAAPGYVTVNGKDEQVGDHHYRIYEMGGAVQLACDAKRMTYDEVQEATKGYKMWMPSGKEHDAVYDCFKQIKMLNGLIALLREQ